MGFKIRHGNAFVPGMGSALFRGSMAKASFTKALELERLRQSERSLDMQSAEFNLRIRQQKFDERMAELQLQQDQAKTRAAARVQEIQGANSRAADISKERLTLANAGARRALTENDDPAAFHTYKGQDGQTYYVPISGMQEKPVAAPEAPDMNKMSDWQKEMFDAGGVRAGDAKQIDEYTKKGYMPVRYYSPQGEPLDIWLVPPPPLPEGVDRESYIKFQNDVRAKGGLQAEKAEDGKYEVPEGFSLQQNPNDPNDVWLVPKDAKGDTGEYTQGQKQELSNITASLRKTVDLRDQELSRLNELREQRAELAKSVEAERQMEVSGGLSGRRKTAYEGKKKQLAELDKQLAGAGYEKYDQEVKELEAQREIVTAFQDVDWHKVSGRKMKELGDLYVRAFDGDGDAADKFMAALTNLNVDEETIDMFMQGVQRASETSGSNVDPKVESFLQGI